MFRVFAGIASKIIAQAHRRKRRDLIEPGVQQLCAALNAIPGVETLYSCEGHADRNWSPYVLFTSPHEFAAELSDLLMRNLMSHQLFFWWGFEGSFLEKQIRWTIRVTDRRLLSDEVKNPQDFPRAQIDDDLRAIVEMVAKAAGAIAPGHTA